MGTITRSIGGILLIAGTTIGAGMLALPVITSFSGFYPSIALFILLWVLMLVTAFFFLDVCLAVHEGDNLVSMSRITLGNGGKWFCWVFYLLLLYCLSAAFIAGSAPLFAEILKFLFGNDVPSWVPPLGLPAFFGGFVYLGTKGVDYINRVLMLGLIVSYFALVGLIPAHLQTDFLTRSHWSAALIAVPVVITSFGYHIIIPSLTIYLQRNKKALRWTILIGSSIPLLVYVVWQVLIMGAVPLEMLEQAWTAGDAATVPLAKVVKSPGIQACSRFFSFFAIITSFVGTTLGLSDFLSDGLKLKKDWSGRLISCLLTFVPPLVFVYTYERGFFIALQYAGIFVAVLIGLLPSAMVWKIKHPFYNSIWGRSVIALVALACLGIVVIDLLSDSGALHQLLPKGF